jgi:hypothetical protein
VEVDILGKITGQFLAHKTYTFRCLDLSRRVGCGDIWWRKWERLEQHRVRTINLQTAVHPEHVLRALITKKYLIWIRFNVVLQNNVEYIKKFGMRH